MTGSGIACATAWWARLPADLDERDERAGGARGDPRANNGVAG